LLSKLKLKSLRFEEALSSKVPEQLHHYTNQAGLLGIFQSGELWATKIQYMNDATEFEYAIGAAKTELWKRYSSIHFSVKNWLPDSMEKRQCDLLQWMTNHIDAISEANICSVSFCVDSDLLSQWRGYAGLGVGYSIGFYGSALLEIVQNNACVLTKCIYERELQTQIINELIDGALESAKVRWDNKSSTDDTHLAVGAAFERAILEYGAFFKDTSFSEEQEWRIITSPKHYNDVGFRFREGKSMLTPYFALKIHSGMSWTNKIASVTVGPCPHPKSARIAVQGLLIKVIGYPPPPVSVSKIPYRSW
jgi:Protein of unknown function (DUF2971)